MALVTDFLAPQAELLARAAGIGALMVTVLDPSTLALWGVVATGIIQLVAQWLKARSDARMLDQKHQFEVEDRKLAAGQRAAMIEGQSAIASAAAAQRAAMIDGQAVMVSKADAAFEVSAIALDTANHTNAKIAGIAAAALAQDRATAKESARSSAALAEDTNAAVHRVEDAVTTPPG